MKSVLYPITGISARPLLRAAAVAHRAATTAAAAAGGASSGRRARAMSKSIFQHVSQAAAASGAGRARCAAVRR